MKHSLYLPYMKLCAIFLLALSACPYSAFAYDAFDCVQNVVKLDKDIGEALVVKLCSDASSLAVSQCYIQSFSLDKDIGRGLAIDLCNGARSLQPLTCYKDIFSFDKGIGRGLAIDLCSESTNAQNTINCYVNAGNAGMSRGAASKLCGIPKTQ